MFAVTRAATVTISGLTIENGSNSGGGGINNQGTLTVVNSILTHNSSPHGDGGAIYNHGSQGAAQATLTVTGSTISSNSVSGGFAGGGIANDGSASIGTSTLSNNTSQDWAGGIANFGPSLTVTNSTVADNSATQYAGGILNWSSATITDSTIAGNSAGFAGGIGDGSHAGLKVGATIVANSTSGGDCFLLGSVNDLGYNLADDKSCHFTAATDLANTPAGLSPSGLQNNGGPTQTIALQAGSAAVGHVNSAALCPATDQRGDPRTVPCDIGAYQTSGRAIDVTVSGSQGYGGGPTFTESNDAPSGVNLTGTLTCTTVDGGTPISPALGVRSFTVDGSSCSGLSPSNPNYHLAYAGATNGYVVTQDSTTIGLTTNSASQAYGSEQATTFTVTVRTGNGESLPAAETVTVHVGTTSCPATLTPNATGGRGGCSIGPTDLGVGPYTATATYAGDTDVSGSGPATTPFTVTSPPAIHVIVTGSQTYGGAATFAETDDAPSGVALTGTLVCTTVNGGTAISTTLGVGATTVDGSSCSGLSPSDPNYHLTYAGAVNGYVVAPDSTTTQSHHRLGRPGLRRRAGHHLHRHREHRQRGAAAGQSERDRPGGLDELPGHAYPGQHRGPWGLCDRVDRPRRGSLHGVGGLRRGHRCVRLRTGHHAVHGDPGLDHHPPHHQRRHRGLRQRAVDHLHRHRRHRQR